MRDEGADRIPFILGLARPQRGRSRGYEVRYDEARDQLLVRKEGEWVFAADQKDGGLGTKKKDIETGEDDKGE